MRKLLLLGVLALMTTSCAVNRYGRGQYEGMTKTELKREFKNLKYNGVEDKSSIAHPINGAITVDYVDPKRLAKSNDYIVTTETSILDIIISTVTGGLYSQNTIHVRSNMDSSMVKDSVKMTTPVVKQKKRKKIKVSYNPFGRIGYTYLDFQAPDLNNDPINKNNFNVGVGVDISNGQGLVLSPSIQVETGRHGFVGHTNNDGRYSVDFSEANIDLTSLSFNGIVGYKFSKRIKLFSGVRLLTYHPGSIKWDYTITDNNQFMNGENVIIESGKGNNNIGNGIFYNVPVGLEFDITKKLSLDLRYNLPVFRTGVWDSEVGSAQAGIKIKL